MPASLRCSQRTDELCEPGEACGTMTSTRRTVALAAPTSALAAWLARTVMRPPDFGV